MTPLGHQRRALVAEAVTRLSGRPRTRPFTKKGISPDVTLDEDAEEAIALVCETGCPEQMLRNTPPPKLLRFVNPKTFLLRIV